MESISEEMVEKVWKEVAVMDPAQGNREMVALSKSQPDLLAFLVHATDDIDPAVAELAVFMAFVVYKMFQQGGDFEKVTAEELIELHNSNVALMEDLAGGGGSFAETVGKVEIPTQLHVMRCVVEMILDAPDTEDPLELSDEEALYLFFLLKTVVEALDAKGGKG
ncbi:MAG: hypothetical protein K8I29_06910 [Alphaproteobacteria bacterium]|uniref:Uncharacterized protein n=1 Tax=Candidatus Nitrobium versatile TaxID=2884831 RepID=A0A953JB83_9BACT|nr:hypothetical protein [Candidatus Nitrobium versatile]